MENEAKGITSLLIMVCYMTVGKGRAEMEENRKRYELISRILRETKGDALVLGDMDTLAFWKTNKLKWRAIDGIC